MKRLAFAGLLVAFAIGVAHAADNPWIGTWKLDPARSKLVGETMTYSKTPDGRMRFSDGSTTRYDFGLDGKDYKSWGNHTTSWVADGSNAWKVAVKQDGAVIYESRRELSADGRTLTIRSTGNRPDGSPANDVAVYQRVGSGTGLAGKWRSTKVDVPAPDTYVISSTADGTIRVEAPVYKTAWEGKHDGSDLPIKGPMAPAGFTVSITPLSANRLSYVYKLNGKPEGYSIDTLAPDGKSYSSQTWSPGKKSEAITLVYVRQ